MGKEFIILGIVVAIFFISIILNRRVEVPEGTKLPEKCTNCTVLSCGMNKNNRSDIKEKVEDCEVTHE